MLLTKLAGRLVRGPCLNTVPQSTCGRMEVAPFQTSSNWHAGTSTDSDQSSTRGHSRQCSNNLIQTSFASTKPRWTWRRTKRKSWSSTTISIGISVRWAAVILALLSFQSISPSGLMRIFNTLKRSRIQSTHWKVVFSLSNSKRCFWPQSISRIQDNTCRDWISGWTTLTNL